MRKTILSLGVVLTLIVGIVFPSQFAQAQQGDCSSQDALRMTEEIPADGEYNIWVRLKRENTTAKPFVRVGTDLCFELSLPTDDNWTWVSGKNGVIREELENGDKDFYLFTEQSTILVDKLLVTTSSNCTPVDDGKNCVEDRLDFVLGGISQGPVTGDITIRADQVSQIAGTTYVFSVDGTKFGTASEPPYCMNKTTTNTCTSVAVEGFGYGDHNLEVTAQTTAGQIMKRSIQFSVVRSSTIPPVDQQVSGENSSLQDIPMTIYGVEEGKTLSSPTEIGVDVALGFSGDVGISFRLDNGPNVLRTSRPFCLAIVSSGACNEFDPNLLPPGDHELVVIGSAAGYKQTIKKIIFKVPEGKNSTEVSTSSPTIVISKDLQTASGTVTAGVPSQFVTPGASIVYKVDDEIVAKTNASSPSALIDTSKFSNGSRQITAEVTSLNGDKATLKSSVIIDNNIFKSTKSFLSENRSAAISFATIILTLITGLIFFIRRRILRNREFQTHFAEGIQYDNYIEPTAFSNFSQIFKQGGLAVAIAVVGVTIIWTASNSAQAAPGFGFLVEVGTDANYIPEMYEWTGDMHSGILSVRMVPTETENTDNSSGTPVDNTGSTNNGNESSTDTGATQPSPTPTPSNPPVTSSQTPPSQPSPPQSTPSGMSQHLGMGPLINNDLIPGRIQGVTTAQLGSGGRKPYGEGEPGAFRHRCLYSHMNYDDPILYLNNPNNAHLHTFFGNNDTNAYSTSNSLKNSGASTCSGGTVNRSAYWVPSMIDADGRPLAPKDTRNCCTSDLEIYYKLGYQGIMAEDIQPFPNGLQIIAGNPVNATSATPTDGINGYEDNTQYWCEDMEANGNRYQQGASIPNCSVGQMLTMYVGFPQCWDGKNLESVNGRSHMTYGTWRPNKSTPGGCPATHPVGLPFIEFFVRYTVSDPRGSGGWKLSSDDYSSGPGGYSGHADYIFAWDENAFPKVRQYCYIEQYDCGYSFGDGTAPRAVRDWSGDLIKRENYPF